MRHASDLPHWLTAEQLGIITGYSGEDTETMPTITAPQVHTDQQPATHQLTQPQASTQAPVQPRAWGTDNDDVHPGGEDRHNGEISDTRRSTQGNRRSPGSNRKPLLILSAVVVAIAALLGGVLLFTAPTEPETDSAAAVNTPAPYSAAPDAVAGDDGGQLPEENIAPVDTFCPTTESTESVTITNEPGDNSTAKGVIASWAHAVFSKKDAAAAYSLTTQSRAVTDMAGLTALIGQLPRNTKWCITIMAGERPETFFTRIRYTNADTQEETMPLWLMNMTVEQRGDHWRISALSNAV